MNKSKHYLASLEAFAELGETTAEIEETNQEIEGLHKDVDSGFKAADTLDALSNVQDTFTESPEIPKDAVDAAQIAFESICIQLGAPIKKKEDFAFEDFKGIATEVWETLKRVAKRIWEQVQLLVQRFMFGKERLVRTYNSLVERASKIEGRSKNAWLSEPSLAHFFSSKRKADVHTVNELVDRTNFLVKDANENLVKTNMMLNQMTALQPHGNIGHIEGDLNNILRQGFLRHLKPIEQYKEDGKETFVFGPFPGAKVILVGTTKLSENSTLYGADSRIEDYTETSDQIELLKSQGEIRSLLKKLDPTSLDFDEVLNLNRHLVANINITLKKLNLGVQQSVAKNEHENAQSFKLFSYQFFRIITLVAKLQQRSMYIHYSMLRRGYEYIHKSLNEFEATDHQGVTVDA